MPDTFFTYSNSYLWSDSSNTVVGYTSSISGLPAGKYVIEAWHEKLGTQTADITVDDSGASQDFSFKKPSKKK